MLRIRLSRVGAKKQASYRIVVADVEARRDGRVVERIGFYNPRTDPLTYKIEESRALYWLSVGAQPSDAVRRLLAKQGTLDRLGRLRAGEPLEKLAAEFGGVAYEAPAAAAERAPVQAVAATETAAEVTTAEAVEAQPEAAADEPEAAADEPEVAEDQPEVAVEEVAGADEEE
jgi:small subunit ribosomal protein S16